MMGIFFYVVLEKYIKKNNEVRYGVCLSKQRIRDLGFVSVSLCLCVSVPNTLGERKGR